MALVNNGGEISNSTIASNLRVNLRTVQRIRKKLEDTWDVDATIKRAPKEEGADRKVRDTDFVDKVKKMVEDDPTRSMKAGDRPWNCYDVVTKDLWPPNSPDLNPLDYFVWGYVERHTKRHPHSTNASLMDSIKEVFGNMDNEMVRRAYGRFRGRIEAVIDANGDYIK
ncbi:unnamed protein product [Lepeophtheirus salmonis]|uniref:(salmon louse) hypothetical protein n=1 Tax=Lepeophtheirus salmonis TaxID=72036 RepID=A0A7R8CNS6_LEPSM|nr:unnamed protein product [Lepeophtheirus salmonis]CAF2878429.1 unnamed protein product [Lepeophtheirus salmonis]